MKELLDKFITVVPILARYPLWTRILISAWVLFTAVTLISLFLTKPVSNVEARTGSTPKPVLPSPGSALPLAPKVISASSVDALRKVDGVRPLRDLENDLNIGHLPSGTYGFTIPWIINTDPTGVVGGTGPDRIFLEQSGGGTAVMEVHKAADGTIYIVGWVSETDLVRLQDPLRRTTAEVTLFFGPYREFSLAVAIPLSQIQKSENRSVGDHYVNDLEVR